MHKITAPVAHHVGFIGSESDPAKRTWIVLGVGYTDDKHIAQLAQRKGYTVEDVEGIPESHTAAIATLEAYGFATKNHGRADGADPEAIYHFTGKDGHTQIDIRNVLAGLPDPIKPTN